MKKINKKKIMNKLKIYLCFNLTILKNLFKYINLNVFIFYFIYEI